MNKSANLPELLDLQKKKSTQLFSQQYPEATVGLSEQKLADFQHALMASDFILNSALQCPKIVVSLLKLQIPGKRTWHSSPSADLVIFVCFAIRKNSLIYCKYDYRNH